MSEALLRKLVDGSATPEERARAAELMSKDPKLARQHRAMVEAERALAGGPLDVPSAAELDALLPRILPAQPVAHASRAWLAIPAVAAACAIAFVVVRSDDEFTARGGTSASNAMPLEVFCVENGAPRALSVSAPSCPVGASLVIGLPTSMAGERVRMGFVDAARTRHDAGEAAVPPSGLPPLQLDVAPTWAKGRGDVVVDVGARSARRPVDIP
jgi:hypothetical protein